jgi:hypothetical protein
MAGTGAGANPRASRSPGAASRRHALFLPARQSPGPCSNALSPSDQDPVRDPNRFWRQPSVRRPHQRPCGDQPRQLRADLAPTLKTGTTRKDGVMRRTQLRIAMVLLLATVPACGKNKAVSPAAHVQGTPHTDDVLAAWRNAGLAPEGFARVEPAPNSATYCEHGKVRGVDTLVCEYTSEDALARGTAQVKEGWARVDAHTGVILRAKRTMMVVVDRERREPSGKTISLMAKVFGKL